MIPANIISADKATAIDVTYSHSDLD